MALTETELKELVAQTGNLNTSGLICRDKGHRWDDGTTSSVVGGYEEANQCERCTTERYRFLDRGFYIETSWRYVYPDEGYMVRGMGVLNADHKATLRGELIQRRAGHAAIPAPRAETIAAGVKG